MVKKISSDRSSFSSVAANSWESYFRICRLTCSSLKTCHKELVKKVTSIVTNPTEIAKLNVKGNVIAKGVPVHEIKEAAL